MRFLTTAASMGPLHSYLESVWRKINFNGIFFKYLKKKYVKLICLLTTSKQLCLLINTQFSKIGKSAISKVQKHIFCYFKNGKKSIFCTRKKFKTTKNAILNFFSGAKIDFLQFFKLRKMCFCTFEIALFSQF